MKNTNRSTSMRVASVMMVLALVLTCSICGTMAKYISTTSNNDSATVAKWEFKINDLDIADTTQQTMAFDLFATTVNDTGDAAAESDVDTAKSLIAPGTAGHFDLTVENLSEVNAKYTVELTETNASNVFIQYALTDKGETPAADDWDDDLTAINNTLTATEAGIDIEMNEGKDEYTLHWRWVYDAKVDTTAHAGQTDAADTALGIAAQETAPTVELAIDLTAWQVD